MKTIEKKNKGGAKITKQQVKNHLCIFVNCLVDNPTFDSQTKDNLTTRPKQFKDNKECELSDKFLKQVSKSSIVENVLAFAKYKQNRELKKVGGVKKIKLTGIAKLDDANKAGSAQSSNCTLIITEGDVSIMCCVICTEARVYHLSDDTDLYCCIYSRRSRWQCPAFPLLDETITESTH